MSEDRFMSFFRMTRKSFNALAAIVSNDSIFRNDSRNPQVSPIIQLATTLYLLGSFGSSTVRAAAQLGIGEVTAHLYCNRCIIALVRLSSRFIRWPKPGTPEFRRMRAEIEQQSQFPGCVGFLDGTNIVLQYGPSFYGESYYDRKKQYSFNLQAISDSHRRFTYIASGFPGSVGDATAFGETAFFNRPNVFFSQPDEYILADKAYRITRRCLTPYKEPLASRAIGGFREFNDRFTETRVTIEHAFGVLKNRWRSLRGLPIYIREKSDHGRALSWITACIIVHNFLCDYEDDRVWQVESEELGREREENILVEEDIDEPLGREGERQAGVEWRNRMREHFFEL